VAKRRRRRPRRHRFDSPARLEQHHHQGSQPQAGEAAVRWWSGDNTMRLAFGLGRASPGGPLTMQFAVLHSFSVPPSSSPPSPEKSPMSRAAAARKLAGISQLRAPPASTGGLLYRYAFILNSSLPNPKPELTRDLFHLLFCAMPWHANLGFSSYGGGSSGSRKGSLPRRVLSIGAISLAGGLVLSAVNDLAIFHGCTTSASFLPFLFWLAPFKTNPVPIYSCAPNILFFLVTGEN
jgi:hypothetical protein